MTLLEYGLLATSRRGFPVLSQPEPALPAETPFDAPVVTADAL